MTWTEVPAPDGRRCWVGAWDDEGCLVLELDPVRPNPWVVTATGSGVATLGMTPRKALDRIGCDLPAPDVEADDHAACLAELDAEPDTVPDDGAAPGPDTNPRTSAVDAVDSEQDDRPVMAWWSGDIPDEDGTRCPYCYREPLTGEHFVLHESEPHPTALAKVMGWRAVEVPHD